MLIPKSNGMNIVGKLRNLKEDSSKFYSIVKHLSANGIVDLKALDLDKYFSYPKPVSLIKEMVSGMTLFTGKQEEIIMDFFSGSATTAQAVMQLNAEDKSGNRKFIMIQLPETFEESSDAYKKGYRTICDVGQERIRRAAKAIRDDTSAEIDYGFRVFKVDDSNMTDVYYGPAEYSQDLLSMLESNVKVDRNDLDLLFGCLLEWGLPLSLPYHSEEIDGCTIHDYNEGDLIACFDEDVPDSVIKEIAKRQPLRVVFRDSCFADSPSKINVSEIFKLLSPDTSIKVI